MASYLVDTNVWSEALKKDPNPTVIAWLRKNESNLYLSTVTIGEIKYGIESLENGRRKKSYQLWLSALVDRLKGRILSYNSSVANTWGQMQAKADREGVRIASLDSLIAGTALRHGLTISTRNVKDFQNSGVKIFNPFDADSPSLSENGLNND